MKFETIRITTISKNNNNINNVNKWSWFLCLLCPKLYQHLYE